MTYRDKEVEMTLLDGTVVRVGDKVRAKPVRAKPSWRVCEVLEIFRGVGVQKALLSTPSGTIIRSRYQIKSRKGSKRNCK